MWHFLSGRAGFRENWNEWEKEAGSEVFTSNPAQILVHPEQTVGYQTFPAETIFRRRNNFSVPRTAVLPRQP